MFVDLRLLEKKHLANIPPPVAINYTRYQVPGTAVIEDISPV